MVGRTKEAFTGWQQTGKGHYAREADAPKIPAIKVHVPTAPCGYKNPPIYFTSLVQPGTVY
jgi:hypothetical protein